MHVIWHRGTAEKTSTGTSIAGDHEVCEKPGLSGSERADRDGSAAEAH